MEFNSTFDFAWYCHRRCLTSCASETVLACIWGGLASIQAIRSECMRMFAQKHFGWVMILLQLLDWFLLPTLLPGVDKPYSSLSRAAGKVYEAYVAYSEGYNCRYDRKQNIAGLATIISVLHLYQLLRVTRYWNRIIIANHTDLDRKLLMQTPITSEIGGKSIGYWRQLHADAT